MTQLRRQHQEVVRIDVLKRETVHQPLCKEQSLMKDSLLQLGQVRRLQLQEGEQGWPSSDIAPGDTPDNLTPELWWKHSCSVLGWGSYNKKEKRNPMDDNYWEWLPVELRQYILFWRWRQALALVHKELLLVVPLATLDECVGSLHNREGAWKRPWSTHWVNWGLAAAGYQQWSAGESYGVAQQVGAKTYYPVFRNSAYQLIHSSVCPPVRDLVFFTLFRCRTPRNCWGEPVPNAQ